MYQGEVRCEATFLPNLNQKSDTIRVIYFRPNEESVWMSDLVPSWQNILRKLGQPKTIEKR